MAAPIIADHGGVCTRDLGTTFTCVATWRGFVYVAFVVDVFARGIVGWCVSASLRTHFMLDALDHAIHERMDDGLAGLVHRSGRGVQYVSMRYIDRLADFSIAPSVGSRGKSYENALAESVIGLSKTEVMRRQRPWRSLETVECAPVTWVDWSAAAARAHWLSATAEYEARRCAQAEVA